MFLPHGLLDFPVSCVRVLSPEIATWTALSPHSNVVPSESLREHPGSYCHFPQSRFSDILWVPRGCKRMWTSLFWTAQQWGEKRTWLPCIPARNVASTQNGALRIWCVWTVRHHEHLLAVQPNTQICGVDFVFPQVRLQGENTLEWGFKEWVRKDSEVWEMGGCVSDSAQYGEILGWLSMKVFNVSPLLLLFKS